MRLSWVWKACLVSVFTAAPAQTYFCIAGNLDSVPPAKIAACEAKLADLRSMVRAGGALQNWHYVMVCDEAGWQSLAALSSTPMLHVAETTDPKERVTLVHGSSLPPGDLRAIQALLSEARLQMTATVAEAKPIQPRRTTTEALIVQGGP